MAVGVSSPPLVTPSRSFQSFSRTLSQSTPESSPIDTPRQTDNSSSSSSSSSASPGPANSTVVTPTTPYQRPSTLHGLKHKLHTAAKSVHSPGRRKSVGHIPLSPLARTPSPSPLPSSPTRSPSPLAFPPGHQPGSSNTTQSYSPGTSVATPGSGPKKGFGRAKSAEPGSPLLRRALSPDRLHPRTAEKPGPASISPLCDPALKVTITSAPRVTITSKSPPVLKNMTVEEDKETIKSKPPVKSSLSSTHDTERSNIKMDEDFVLGSSQPLPRIAEEKDSPTALKEDLPNLKQEPCPAYREPPPIPQKPKSKGSTIKNICTGKKWKNRDSQNQKQGKEDDASEIKASSATIGGSKSSSRK
uniref:Uncharacterized protein n=1 Tax=Cuerna arida TaxID=1464854 RepID=A0A1B6FLS0_9HEMI